MFNKLNTITIKKCDYNFLQKYISEYYVKNNIIVDSFWETHVRESNFYKIMDVENAAGYFAIYKETVLILFHVFEKYRNISQELFAIIKKYESIKEALVPTGDEFFISHAIDNYTGIEKQAYFSIYTDKTPSKILSIELQLADIEKDREILSLCYDFLKEEIENIKNTIDEEIYIAKNGNDIIGFGVIEYQKIVEIYASIGMIVREEFRQNGYGANILNGLKNIVRAKGKIPISGCWYYNHNSKKTMESAGAYSKTRLLRFYF
jgi:hypothetical protein